MYAFLFFCFVGFMFVNHHEWEDTHNRERMGLSGWNKVKAFVRNAAAAAAIAIAIAIAIKCQVWSRTFLSGYDGMWIVRAHSHYNINSCILASDADRMSLFALAHSLYRLFQYRNNDISMVRNRMHEALMFGNSQKYP